MVTAEDLSDATERAVLTDSEGKSGAVLERMRLADGTRVIVKRFVPEHDLVMTFLGDTRGREVQMWLSGFFDRLPPDVGHAILGGWFEPEGGVLVMRDLGAAMLSWDDRLDRARCGAAVDGAAALHRAFLDRPTPDLAALSDVVGLFEPRRLAPYAGAGLVDAALRGWELFPEVAPGEAGEAVFRLGHDTSPLTRALAALPTTVLHGDLSTVNMAFEDGRFVLIDWGVSTAGPGPLDLGRFLAGCAHVLDVSPDDFVALYRERMGDVYDERAIGLGLLAGFTWLAWNKALDIVDHPDPQVRERERTALAWWLDQVGRALDAGL